MELREYHARTVQNFADRVRAVPPGAWGDPTPCTDWSVRDLVNHLAYELRWSVPILQGATIQEVGDRFDGDLLGGDPAGVIEEAARRSIAAVGALGAYDTPVHLSFGVHPASFYLAQLGSDHLIHGWDLAAAIGADRELDPDLVAYCREFTGDRDLSGSGVIGPPAPVPPEPSPQDRLIATYGRDPRWRPSA